MINVGMVAGLLPVTGLPLPFISSGGSFLIISLIGVGVLESVAMKNRGVI
jgi:cell division protein FtsW (lipid II flippase)